MRSKLLYWLAVHTLVVASLSIFVAIFWLVYPYNPIVITHDPFPVLNKNKVVHSGEVLVYRSSSCRNFIGEIRVHRTLVNHSLIDFPDSSFHQQKKECRIFDNRTLLIPSYAPSGKYKLKISNFVQVNPIRTISVTAETEEFTVINKHDESR